MFLRRPYSEILTCDVQGFLWSFVFLCFLRVRHWCVSITLSPWRLLRRLFIQLMLSMLGLKSNETGRVSEEELRLIVTGAKMSGGIESQEGMMIEGVLDLQVCVLVSSRATLGRSSPSRSIDGFLDGWMDESIEALSSRIINRRVRVKIVMAAFALLFRGVCNRGYAC